MTGTTTQTWLSAATVGKLVVLAGATFVYVTVEVFISRPHPRHRRPSTRSARASAITKAVGLHRSGVVVPAGIRVAAPLGERE